MHALAAALVEPLVVQDGIDNFGRRLQLASGGRPGISKPLCCLASAEKARAMSRCESDCLIEEEQLGPASACHHRAAPPLVFTAANEPSLGGPAPVQQSLRCRIVDDATIADERSPLRYGDNLAKGCDAVLKMHGRLLERRSAPPCRGHGDVVDGPFAYLGMARVAYHHLGLGLKSGIFEA